jgi:uncharacterized protein YjiS (DUF1127 family)
LSGIRGNTVRDDFGLVIDAWARRAAAANGFGDAADCGTPKRQPLCDDAWRPGRAHHAWALGHAICTAVRTFVRIARRWRREREAAATRQALHALDPRTLHDLGFHPSELSSVAAEAHGLARRTRMRVVRPSPAA